MNVISISNFRKNELTDFLGRKYSDRNGVEVQLYKIVDLAYLSSETHYVSVIILFTSQLCAMRTYRGFQVACQNEKCQMQSPLTLTNN